MRLDKFLWFAENSGMDDVVDTYEARMNAVVNEFEDAYRSGEDINNYYLQQEIGIRHGFGSGFSDRESAYIEKELSRRLSH